nr:MAG TPA: hypothetical protein [Caudoviricetes sp.]DAT87493.1 MAG TPA: hypothetical protein [Caudoviricetes sp.]
MLNTVINRPVNKLWIAYISTCGLTKSLYK